MTTFRVILVNVCLRLLFVDMCGCVDMQVRNYSMTFCHVIAVAHTAKYQMAAEWFWTTSLFFFPVVALIVDFYNISEEELIIPDPTKGKKAIAAVLRMKSKKKYVNRNSVMCD